MDGSRIGHHCQMHQELAMSLFVVGARKHAGASVNARRMSSAALSCVCVKEDVLSEVDMSWSDM